jgi:hypothetical protein
VSEWAKWLEISGYGLELLGVMAGAWYIASKWRDRVRRDADKLLSGSYELPPKKPKTTSSHSKVDLYTLEQSYRQKQQDAYPGIGPHPLPDIPPIKDDPLKETEAEDLLAARLAPVLDPFITDFINWGGRVAGKLKPLDWLRFVLLAPLGLVFFALVLLLVLLLLPLAIFGYLFDKDKDYRLRIVVLAFMLGAILQVIKAALH